MSADKTLVTQITSEERAHALGLLRRSRTSLLDVVEPLSDAQWSYRTAPDRWSVGENVEHLTTVEQNIFRRIQKTLTLPEHPDWQTATSGKAEVLERQLLDRSVTRDAPERVRPVGKTVGVDAADAFRDARDTTIAFIRDTDAALKALTYDHHRPIYGTLNIYQWVLFIAFHNLRHNEQVAEVVADPGFPVH